MKKQLTTSELTIYDHLRELRKRVFITLAGILVGTITAFIFHRAILAALIDPSLAITKNTSSLFIYTQVAEMLGISMKVSLLGGLILAMPLIAYEFLMFVSPGLNGREKRFLYMSLPVITITFIGGMAFGYFALIPPAIKFLLTFNADIAPPMIRIGNYINLIITLVFWMGIVFETPIFMFVLAKIKVVTYKTFSKWRRLAIVLAFILSAAITPTFDPINQTIVALPIILLYEVGIWLSWLARRSH